MKEPLMSLFSPANGNLISARAARLPRKQSKSLSTDRHLEPQRTVRGTERVIDSQLMGQCFEPSQPLWIISGLDRHLEQQRTLHGTESDKRTDIWNNNELYMGQSVINRQTQLEQQQTVHGTERVINRHLEQKRTEHGTERVIDRQTSRTTTSCTWD